MRVGTCFVPATVAKGDKLACRAVSPESLVEKLILKIAEGDLDTMEMLLSHGVDVNARDKTGLTALHAAKIHGREDFVKVLLENGADPSVQMPATEELVDPSSRVPPKATLLAPLSW